jgi:hypothetical protein
VCPCLRTGLLNVSFLGNPALSSHHRDGYRTLALPAELPNQQDLSFAGTDMTHMSSDVGTLINLKLGLSRAINDLPLEASGAMPLFFPPVLFICLLFLGHAA